MADDPRHAEAELAGLSDDDLSIATQLARVAAAMIDLTAELRESQPRMKRIDRRSFWQVLTSIVGVLLVALLLSLVIGGYQVVAVIKDCTDPAGQCYRESRSRTGEVEARIMKAQADAMDRNLKAVCAVFVEHRLAKPPECPPA